MRFLNELEDKVLGNTRIIRRGDAHRHPYGGGETGYIKIKLPVSFNDTTQVHKIVINTTQFSDEIRVCGCNTPSYGWVETSAKAKFRVRLGSDSGYGCILIGEASSVWDYAFVYLKESILYGSGRSDADWANPCEVSITSDISSITDISECPPENILAVDIDDYHPATIEGDCPALLLHAVGRTGGIAMDVFKAEVTNSEGTSALFGKIGFFGDSFGSGGSGGGSGDPSVSYMYMGAGIDTAWDNALFKISPSGVGIGLPSADGPEEKLHVSGRIRSDSILLDNGVHQTTIGQLSTEEHNNYFKFITSAANGFFFQGTVNTSGEVYVNWGGNKVWHNGDFDIADYLAKDNTTEYTPTEDYHPATKKFVQDNATGAVYGEYEPVGTVKQFVGTVAPDNYIFGLGQELNRVEYAELFAVIGTTFGAGNGTTTFNAPNFSGYTAVGVDSADTNLNTVGKKYGTKTHTLVLNEIPSHSHTYPVNGQGSGAQYGPNATTSQTGNPKTNTDNAGGGLAHNNMQPSMAVNYIIKYRSTSDLINKVQAPAQVKTYVIGDAVSSSFTINHGFNTDKLLVRMEYYATKQNYPSINYTIVDNNNISIEFDIVPTQDEFQITLVILQSEIQLNSFDQTFGDGSTTTFTFTHNLNVRYPDVKVIRLSDNEYIYPRVIYTNTTSLQVIFATAPAMNTYKVFIQSGISKVNDADTLCGKAISELMDMIYPVGSIYMSVSNTNPGTLFGGTWAAWGAGKVPVGIDTAQSEFNTIEETGGEKTHVLTGAESGEKGHRHSYINVPSSDGHRFRWTGSGGYSPGYSGASAVITNTVTGEEIYTSTIAASNASSAHNNLQPYIVCYMWKRTA